MFKRGLLPSDLKLWDNSKHLKDGVWPFICTDVSSSLVFRDVKYLPRMARAKENAPVLFVFISWFPWLRNVIVVCASKVQQLLVLKFSF